LGVVVAACQQGEACCCNQREQPNREANSVRRLPIQYCVTLHAVFPWCGQRVRFSSRRAAKKKMPLR
jgi:hypothetical protein